MQAHQLRLTAIAVASVKIMTLAATAEEEFGTVVWLEPYQTYAVKGEVVTCENGHFICEFLDTVNVGQSWDSTKLGRWRQPEPKLGTMKQPCTSCNARWFEGSYLHFPDGWRVSK